MFGPIVIEITLAPSGVLMLGASPTANALAAITGSQIGTNIDAASQVAAAIVAEGISYKLSDISFTMVRYDLPKAVTDAMTAVLESNSVYQYWFPSYTSFMGQPTTTKTGVTRISLSTSSLEMYFYGPRS